MQCQVKSNIKFCFVFQKHIYCSKKYDEYAHKIQHNKSYVLSLNFVYLAFHIIFYFYLNEAYYASYFRAYFFFLYSLLVNKSDKRIA